MRDCILAIAVFATIAISLAVDEECIQRKLRRLPVHWPNPTDCSSFYRCTNKNIKRALVCPEGREYNPTTGRCGNKGRSQCRLSLAAPLAEGDNNPCADKISGTYMPDPKSCRSFYMCNNNAAYPQICNLGSYFDSKISACAPDPKSLCWENLCVGKANGTSVADEKDCYSFYICFEQKPNAQKCPDKSYFNEKDLNCQPGKCPTDDTTTTTITTTTTSDTTTTPDTTTKTKKTTTTTPVTTTRTKSTTTTAPDTTTSTKKTTTAPETTTTTCTVTTTTTTCTPEATTTTCAPETTTTTCTPETTTTTCAPEPTTTTCTPETTTTTCAPETTTPTCAPETTTTTCAPETTITTCTPETTTTTCAPETTTTTCSVVTTTTCASEKTSTTCAPDTTTLTPETTTCPPVTITPKSTTCATEITTTTCPPQETTTPANDDCPNLKCIGSNCQNARDGLVFSASNSNAGFCVCLNRKPEYRKCPDNGIFNENLLICVAQDKVCPSSRCSQLPDDTTFPASNTTDGFCKCLNGRATFFDCIGSDYVYDNKLSFCVKSKNISVYQETAISATKLCAGRYSEGDFVAHSDNCKLLYICYEGELVEVSCETGNYYEENIGACLPDTEGKCAASHQAHVYFSDNRPRNKRSVGARCVEGSKTPAADCDKYYKCSGGHRLLYGCGKDNFFNITTLSCQLDVQNVCYPINSCTEGVKNPYPDDDTKYYECVKGKQMVFSCGVDSYFNKLSKTCVTKEVCTCPGGYKDGEISAHPTDCDKFYICRDGKQILQECYNGYYFNKKTLSCEKDVKNICNVKQPCLCPGGYQEGELSAVPNECDKFYICLDGKQVLKECGENNYFNNKTLTCQPDLYNECWTKEICTCPGGYDEGDLSAHPTECNKYFICHDGHQMLMDCGVNNYFNKNTLTCQPDIDHVCWPNLCAGQPNGALVANPQQCNAYFLCEKDKAIAKTCFEGQLFEPSLPACVDDFKAVCYNPCANENVGPIVLLPHPICNEYYFCNGRKTFVGTCQVGSFDIATGVCDETKKCFPNPCDNSSISAFPDPYDPSKFYWCNREKQPISSSCPSGMEFNLEYKICKKVSDPDCPLCTKDGSFPSVNENSNNEFCVCVKGLATKIECPDGYIFSRELGICYSNAPCDPSFCLDAKEYETAPNRNDSKSFCMCINKKPIIINCPNNGTFNPYTLECSDYEVSPECLQSTCIGQPSNTHIFKPIDTKKSNGFCQCINQIATFRPCNYGSTLNPDLLICQLAEINCNSYQCRGLADKSLIAAVTTTEGYCECIAGVATYYNCPDNGEFNVTASKCQAPLCDLTKCTDTNKNNPFPASIPNGFCMCNAGYIPCPTECTLFSEIYKSCVNPCPQSVCDGKPDKYLASSAINKNSFCVCHKGPAVAPTYEVCPSDSFVFNEAEQRCVADAAKFCGTDICKTPGAFQAKDTLTGFCLCLDKGKKPTFEKCLEGIYVPDKKACLPTAEDVCDVSKCVDATNERPITLPANNTILEFCYCSSPNNVMLLPCPNGKYYNQDKAMCVSQQEDGCLCPNDVAEGKKVADTTTCNKYSICVDGIMESRTCPNGYYFNVNINDCMLDTKGVCFKTSDCTCLGIYYENELLPHPVNPQMYYACHGNTLHEYKCQTDRIFSATQKQCVLNTNLRRKRSIDHDHEFGCLENEKRSVPSNCSQFEICLQRTWKRKSCSHYRYYNPEQRKCIEPRDDFVCSYAKVTSLPTCNASMQHYLLRAKNCHQYYRCQDGKWRLKSCGRQQYFNVNKSTCLSVPQDQLFKCELLGNITFEEVKEPPTCQHLSQRFYGKNCAMYLICLDNDWLYQYCPPDMYYNRTLNYCLQDTHQQCKDVIKTGMASETEEFFQDSCQQDGLLRPSAMACNRYYVCLNGKWQMQHCSLGEFYDVTNAKCSADTGGICAQLNKDCLPNERKSIPRNCSFYEQCSNEGKWLKMACPQDDIFDELLQQCTTNQGICSKYGLKRTCRQHETMPVTQNCSLFYYCSQDTWSLGSCLKGFMYSIERQMCIAHMSGNSCKPFTLNETQSNAMSFGQENELCQRKPDGTAIAHPIECYSYYICIQQTLSHKMQCSKGSYFDSNLGYCRPNDGSCRLPLTGVCANVTDESLVPYHSDCQAFYKCSSINGTELLHCPEGQYFHNHTSQCRIDHGECRKDLVPKQKCSGFNHGTRLAHETFCNIYYACVKGLTIPIECPANYQFNSSLSKCVEDKQHQCPYQHLVESNVTIGCGNLSDGTYFADPRDCTRYYICFQGQGLPKKCMNSSFFDNEQLLCVPDDGSCPFVNDEAGQHHTLPPDPIVCEGKHGYLLADPLNCNNFYACINNKLKHESCYSQQFFNTTSQQCQKKPTLEVEINGNATINDTNVDAAKSQKPQCLDEIITLKKLCFEMSKGTSLAEPGDCRRFIICQDSDEEPLSQRCRNGESFDGLLGFCRQNDGTCLLENGQRVGECSGKQGQLTRDPQNCRGYFVCINGQKIAQNCKDDEYFSKTQNMCIKDTQKVCQTTQANEGPMIQSCKGLSESVLYPYIHDDCHSYFQCIKGIPKIHKCADDLFFDPLAIKCIRNKTECVMPTQTQRSPALSQTFTKLCSNKKLEYPYANIDNDCRSFYLCHANGFVSHELCPLGTIFSKELNMCTNENKTSCT